jgi:hypothetical protein
VTLTQSRTTTSTTTVGWTRALPTLELPAEMEFPRFHEAAARRIISV